MEWMQMLWMITLLVALAIVHEMVVTRARLKGLHWKDLKRMDEQAMRLATLERRLQAMETQGAVPGGRLQEERVR